MFKHVALVQSVEEAQLCTIPEGQYLILAAQGFDFESLADAVSGRWMGAVFPAVFDKRGTCEKSAYVCELSDDAKLVWLEDIAHECTQGCQSFLTIVDGADPEVGHKLEMIFANTPAESVIFGGGAGCFGHPCRAYMYNGKAYAKHGIIVLGSPKPFTTNVGHGYESEGNFMIASKAFGNTLEEIDFKPAFVTYKEILKQKFNETVTPETLFEIGLKHPLVFERVFGVNSVRNPLSTDGKSMVLAGDVTEDSVFSLGTTSTEQLLNASRECVETFEKSQPDTVIVFDCIGRKLFLKEAFNEELDTLIKSMNGSNMVGVLSFGEIANTSKNFLEFYNSTCIVGSSNAL